MPEKSTCNKEHPLQHACEGTAQLTAEANAGSRIAVIVEQTLRKTANSDMEVKPFLAGPSFYAHAASW